MVGCVLELGCRCMVLRGRYGMLGVFSLTGEGWVYMLWVRLVWLSWKGPIACSLTSLRALLFSCFDSVTTPCLLVSDLGLGIVSCLLVPIVFLVRIVFRFVIYLVTRLGVSHNPEFQGLVSYLVLSVLCRCWDDIHNWQRRVFVLLYLKLYCCSRIRR